MNETLIELAIPRLSPPGRGFWLAQVRDDVSETGTFLSETASRFADFVPGLLGAIAILIIGWIVATVAAAAIKGILNRTQIDNRIAKWITGADENSQSPPIEKWAATAIYWLIMAFVIVAFLQALNLQVVSEPLNDFLGTIFEYLPRIGGALLLLGAAWLLATIAKMVLTRLLGRFNLDDRLASASGTSDTTRTSATTPSDTVPESTAPGSTVEGRTTETGTTDSPFLVNETLGNAVYWFVLLFFLPLILDVLGLQGPLQPVQNLLDDILSVSTEGISCWHYCCCWLVRCPSGTGYCDESGSRSRCRSPRGALWSQSQHYRWHWTLQHHWHGCLCADSDSDGDRRPQRAAN